MRKWYQVCFHLEIEYTRLYMYITKQWNIICQEQTFIAYSDIGLCRIIRIIDGLLYGCIYQTLSFSELAKLMLG